MPVDTYETGSGRAKKYKDVVILIIHTPFSIILFKELLYNKKRQAQKPVLKNIYFNFFTLRLLLFEFRERVA